MVLRQEKSSFQVSGFPLLYPKHLEICSPIGIGRHIGGEAFLLKQVGTHSVVEEKTSPFLFVF